MTSPDTPTGRPPAAIEDVAALLKRPHLPALDGLRAVAVFTVMVYHFGVEPVPGDLGVAGFFVLSGFLITWLLRKELANTGKVSLRDFYVRRVLRIFPAYYVFLAVSFGNDLRHGRLDGGVVSSAVFYLINYYNALHGHPDTSVAHAWSLAVEEQFYLLWPVLFIVLSARGPRFIRNALAWIIAGVMAWRCLLFLGFHVDTAWVYNAFDCRFDNLAVGCLLAFVLDGEWWRATARRLASRAWLPLVTVALLVVSRKGPEAWHYGPGFTVNAVLIAIFIVQMLQLYRSPFWSWLEHPVIRYLGRISYPLYLYHALAGAFAGRFARGPISFTVATVLSIAMASASYQWIEKPFLRLKKRFEIVGKGTGSP